MAGTGQGFTLPAIVQTISFSQGSVVPLRQSTRDGVARLSSRGESSPPLFGYLRRNAGATSFA